MSEPATPDFTADKLAIRELVENWAVWRDAGLWERFRGVWHEDGRMRRRGSRGPLRISSKRVAGVRAGVRILHFLGGTSIDVDGTRAYRADEDDDHAAGPDRGREL